MSIAASTSVANAQSALRKIERQLAERTAENKELRRRNADLIAELKALRREFTAFREQVKKLLGHTPKSKQLAGEGQLPLFGSEELPEAPFQVNTVRPQWSPQTPSPPM